MIETALKVTGRGIILVSDENINVRSGDEIVLKVVGVEYLTQHAKRMGIIVNPYDIKINHTSTDTK